MKPSQGWESTVYIAHDLSIRLLTQCSCVATEAWAVRHFRPVESLDFNSPSIFKDPVNIVLCEDRYECWLAPEDAKRAIAPVKEDEEYQPRVVEKEDVQERMPDVIKFVRAAHQSEDRYLWGGTAGPHFDCSGLVQRAYSSVGIWLPRDAYQQGFLSTSDLSKLLQQEFVEKVPDKDLKRGDLLFFEVERATHVGICVEVPSRDEGCSNLEGDAPPVEYIHASSSTHGHGHIELDELALNAGPVAKHYFSMYRASGRIVRGL